MPDAQPGLFLEVDQVITSEKRICISRLVMPDAQPGLCLIAADLIKAS
jgi:hypothetical protein